jgi:hypothetical protein
MFSKRNPCFKCGKSECERSANHLFTTPIIFRLLYHKQLINSPIISLLSDSEISFSLKKSLARTFQLQYGMAGGLCPRQDGHFEQYQCQMQYL